MSLEKICNSCGKRYVNEVDFLIDTTCWRVCAMGNLYFNCSCSSTLMIPAGKYPWYSPERRMGLEARGIFNDFSKDRELPRIKSIFLEFQEEVSHQQVDVKKIEQILKKDPLFAAKIVEFANFRQGLNRNSVIKRIDHAIVSLGHSCLYGLAVSLAIKDFIPKAKRFSVSEFWLEPMLTSAIGTQLCLEIKDESLDDQLFLSAALCNIGKLVMAFFMPDDFDAILALLEEQKTHTWKQAEKIVGAKSHIIMGEIGLAFWGLPEFLRDPIRNHHVDASGFKRNGSVLVCSAVNYCLAAMHILLGQEYRLEQHVLASAIKELGQTRAQFDDFVAKNKKSVGATREFLKSL